MSRLASLLRQAAQQFQQGGIKQLMSWFKMKMSNRKARKRLNRQAAARISTSQAGLREIKYFVPSERPVTFPFICAGALLSDRAKECWSHEFALITLDLANAGYDVNPSMDFVFIESTELDAYTEHTSHESTVRQLNLISKRCQTLNIPIALWVTSQKTEASDILEYVNEFDHIFVSSPDKLSLFDETVARQKVSVLQFAAQPAIHNPINPKVKGPVRSVAWKEPHSSNPLEPIISDIKKAGKKYAFTCSSYSLDNQYRTTENHLARNSATPYSNLVAGYKSHKVFLNTDTDNSGNSLFEVFASGTPVVSYSNSPETDLIDDFITNVRRPDDYLDTVRFLLNSQTLRDRIAHKVQREIWSSHTYTHRALDLIQQLDINSPTTNPYENPQVTVILSTNRPNQINHSLEQVARQTGVKIQFALLTHGFTVNESELRDKAHDHGIEDFRLLHLDSSYLLGDCLNALTDVADGDFIAKFDDDDIYCPNYLLDQVNSIHYTGADLVGKRAHYIYTTESNLLSLRNRVHEHTWTNFVAGATLVIKSDILKTHRFASKRQGEDTDLLIRLVNEGANIYSSDRFNYSQVRHDLGHTWQTSDNALLANAIVESIGFNEAHISC